MFMSNPRLNPLILLSPVEDGYIAYDPVLDRLHQLNPIAALLLELCDGSRSVDDIRALGGPLMPSGTVNEVSRWITESVNIGLVIWEGSESTAVREMTAAELHALARRLCEKGSVQTAYL